MNIDISYKKIELKYSFLFRAHVFDKDLIGKYLKDLIEKYLAYNIAYYYREYVSLQKLFIQWFYKSIREQKNVISEISSRELRSTDVKIHKVEPESEWDLDNRRGFAHVYSIDNVIQGKGEHAISNTEYKYISIGDKYSLLLLEKELSDSQKAINFMHFALSKNSLGCYNWILINYAPWFWNFCDHLYNTINIVKSEHSSQLAAYISFIIFDRILAGLYSDDLIDKVKKMYNIMEINNFLSSNLLKAFSYKSVESFYKYIEQNHKYLYDEISKCLARKNFGFLLRNNFWKHADKVVQEFTIVTQKALYEHVSQNAKMIKKQMVVDVFTRFWKAKSIVPQIKEIQRNNHKAIKYFARLFFTINNPTNITNLILLILSHELSPMSPVKYIDYHKNQACFRTWPGYGSLSISIDYKIQCDKPKNKKITASVKNIEFSPIIEDNYDWTQYISTVPLIAKKKEMFSILDGMILLKILTRNVKKIIEIREHLIRLISNNDVELVYPSMIIK